MIRTRRLIGAGAVTCAVLLSIPAAGQAASLTVTNDAGVPTPYAQGLTLRNMNPEVNASFTTAELSTDRRYKYTLTVDGPAGPAITPVSCTSTTSNFAQRVKYAANGTYNITLNVYPPPANENTTNTCQTTPVTTAAPFVINAFTGIGAPAQGTKLLTRAPGSLDYLSYQFPLDINPGSTNTEVTFAPNAVLTNGTGPISGAPLRDGPDPGVTFSSITPYTPGNYTFLAQATGLYGASPYSAPLAIKVQDPFDISGGISFSDSRGPRYTLFSFVRTKVAEGKVRMWLKKKGAKKYRYVGAAKIRNSRAFKIRFTQRKTGRYTLRLGFKGSDLVRGGRVYSKVRFTTRRSFG